MAITEGPFQAVTELFAAATTFKMVCVPRASPSTMRFQITRFGGNTFTVDWGDGNPVTYNEGTTPAVTPTGNVIVEFEFDRAKVSVLDDEIEDITITGAAEQLERLTLTNQTLLETLSIDDSPKLRFLYCGNCTNLTTLDFGTNDMSNLIELDFTDCSSLLAFPAITTSPSWLTASMDFCFSGCSSLVSVGLFDVSGVTSARRVFYLCTSLTTLPAFNFANASDLRESFRGCTSLVTFPAMTFGKAASMEFAFRGCTALVTFNNADLSNATSLSGAFEDNDEMTTCLSTDFSSCTDFDDMFQDCRKLTSLGNLQTEAGTTFDRMFQNCFVITSIGAIDTTAMTPTAAGLMFQNCSNLTSPDSATQTLIASLPGYDFN